MAYKGNANLRDHNEVIQVTPEQIEEIIKCSQDIFYFAEQYFYITHIDYGNIKIPLREYQKRMLQSFVESEYELQKNRVVLSARQIGKCVHEDTVIKVASKIEFENQNKYIRKIKNFLHLLLTGKKLNFIE